MPLKSSIKTSYFGMNDITRDYFGPRRIILAYPRREIHNEISWLQLRNSANKVTDEWLMHSVMVNIVAYDYSDSSRINSARLCATVKVARLSEWVLPLVQSCAERNANSFEHVIYLTELFCCKWTTIDPKSKGRNKYLKLNVFLIHLTFHFVNATKIQLNANSMCIKQWNSNEMNIN